MKLCPHITSVLTCISVLLHVGHVLASDDATFSSHNTRGGRMLNNANRPCRTINVNGNGKDKPCTDEEKTRRRPVKYIVGGSPVTSDSEYQEAIGLIQVARFDSSGNPISVYPEPFCSGTLIAGGVVLTAAHCVKSGGRTTSPNSILIYFGRDVAADINNGVYFSKLAVVQEVLPHPSYRSNRFSNDIALIRLLAERTDETPVDVLPSAIGITSADVGKIELFFVGFGIGGTNGDSTVGKQFIGGIRLDGLTNDPGLWYSQEGELGPCSGDSGGGTYVDRGGTMYNAGVVSYGDAYCKSYGVSTQTDKFYTWISDFIGGPTGPTPTPPSPTSPTSPTPVDNPCGSCGGSKSSGTKCNRDNQCCSCTCSITGKFGTCA